jgi:hypothetical protein
VDKTWAVWLQKPATTTAEVLELPRIGGRHRGRRNSVRKLRFLKGSCHQEVEVCPDIIPVPVSIGRWFQFAKHSIRKPTGNTGVKIRHNFFNRQSLAAFGTSYRHRRLLQKISRQRKPDVYLFFFRQSGASVTNFWRDQYKYFGYSLLRLNLASAFDLN